MTTWLNPLAWMGPIFDKELRVSSRRKRTYWLRLLYIGAMGFFLVPIWADLLPYVEWNYINSLAVSEQAIWITNRLILFQFIALQILAAIFLSSSISEEISRRTLGTLWTTPIRGFEVVAGKLASKMAILVQMLTISLPFLMMLRIFGGIPWNWLIESVFFTLAMSFQVAAMSMLLSIFFRNAIAVVVMVAAILVSVWGLVPILIGIGLMLINENIANSEWLEKWMTTLNPYFVFVDRLFSSSTRVSFWICGLFQTVLGVWLALIAAMIIRKRGLRLMDQLPRREEFRPERFHPKAVFLFRPWFVHLLIKRLLGPGIIWKESVSPFFRTRYRLLFVILMAIGIGLGLWVLLALTMYHAWTAVSQEIQAIVAISGFSLAALLTAITSVTIITGEMERQSWPILLATPWANLHILGGKIYGVLRRSGWMWALLLLWGISTCWQALLPWQEIVKWFILFGVSFGFILSLGFYLALRTKRAVPSIVTSFIVLGFAWFVLPYFLPRAPRFVLSNPPVAVGGSGPVQASDSWPSLSDFLSYFELDNMLWTVSEHFKFSNPFSVLLEPITHANWFLDPPWLMHYFYITIFLYSVLGGFYFY